MIDLLCFIGMSAVVLAVACDLFLDLKRTRAPTQRDAKAGISKAGKKMPLPDRRVEIPCARPIWAGLSIHPNARRVPVVRGERESGLLYAQCGVDCLTAPCELAPIRRGVAVKLCGLGSPFPN